MLNNLEATIHDIIVRASSDMAKQIDRAVRKALAATIIGPGIMAPERRKPGRPRKQPGPAPTAAAAKQARKPVKARRSSKRRAITDAELNVVLDAVAKKPGMTSVQVQKEAGIDSKQAGRVLGKLRATGRVKTKGKRSAATYTTT